MHRPLVAVPRRAAALCLVALATSAPLAATAAARGPLASAPVAWHPADAATEAKVNDWLGKQASGWSPNLGQVAGADGRAASNVLYVADAGGAKVCVTTTGLSHFFFSHAEENRDRRPGKPEVEDEEVRWARLDVTLAGANIRPELARAEGPLVDRGVTHYYLPQCPNGVRDVPEYGSVRFPDVYAGIDWVLRSSDGTGVHHDFVVRPGADPSAIRLDYAGATSIELADDGRSLRVHTALGEVREGTLLCYQDGPSSPIGARFRLEGRSVSVEVGNYDRSRPLVIDPPLVWSTYYGGSDYDGPRSIWCDNANDRVYVVGYVASTNLPLMNPGGSTYYDGTLGGFTDGFIWQFNQLGKRLWATYYGGSNSEGNSDCVTDAAGNLYVTGFTASSDLPLQNLAGAYNQGTFGGGLDGFVLKFNLLGVRQWATYYGGTLGDYPNNITVDAAGKVYLCGQSSSTNLPLADPGGGAYYQGTLGSTSDGFVARFSALGALEWSTFLGGAGGVTSANGVTTHAGSLYVAGETQSTSFPVYDPGGGAYYQPTLDGQQDAFIARFALSGARTWITYFGGDSTDYGDDPVVDASGNLFVSGYSPSPTFPTVNPGGTAYYQSTPSGSSDVFIARFNASNTETWCTYLGGSTDEFVAGSADKSLAVDSQGRVYVTGITTSADMTTLNPGGGSFFQGTFGGSSDIFYFQFANDGTLLWSTFFGTAVVDFGTSVAVSGNDCLFGTGESWDSGVLLTQYPGFGAWYQTANAGSDDGFITKFCTPTSACCQDFNCIPVTSQQECLALNGTAFYPGQTCANTVCNTLCGICGRKFSDLNRNGVQDGGEPGLAGWTIELRDPSGTLYTSATTDALGNWCFNNIPCGSWKVNEVQQPGWVLIAPANGVHTLNLGTGTTQNGVLFANYACPTAAPCASIPIGLVGWWPFNDGSTATAAADVTHADPSRNVALLEGGATSDGDALCLAGAPDYAQVPRAQQLGLEFGSGSFSIASWVRPDAGSATPRVIAEKRDLSPTPGGGPRGWSLYMNGLQVMLEIGDGFTVQPLAGPAVPAEAWSHLVVTVDRASGAGRWYLNGLHASAYDFTASAGDLSSDADLLLGQSAPAFGTAPAFAGCIGDLALFSAPLSADAVQKTYVQGPIGWCPERAVMPSVTSICQNANTAQVCFNICNSTAASQSYHWSLAGLPAGPGCTNAGPSQFSPSSGTVTVPAGGCSTPICVTITRPSGFTLQNATSCFQLTFVNDSTGACRTATSKLRVDNSCWCATPAQAGMVHVPARTASGTSIGIGIGNPCDPVNKLAYRLSAVWLDPDHADPVALSLDGLPPGQPVTGELDASSGVPPSLDVTLRYPRGYDPASRYELVLDADTDGDGVMERLCGSVIEAGYDSVESVSVPRGAPFQRSVKLLVRPNPFAGSSVVEFVLASGERVDLAVFDLSGRRVRSLSRGVLAAGPHRFEWNGRDEGGRPVSAGIYFVRLEGAGRPLQTKLVFMR